MIIIIICKLYIWILHFIFLYFLVICITWLAVIEQLQDGSCAFLYFAFCIFVFCILHFCIMYFSLPGCQWLSNSKMGGGGLELCSNRGGVRYPSHKWGRTTVVPFHCYNRYHHNHNCYDKWCFVTNSARVACTYILGSAMLPVEKKPCQGRGWTYNHPQRSDQDRDPWNR